MNIKIKNKEISEAQATELFKKANTEGLWILGDGYRAGQEEVRDGRYSSLVDVFYTEFYADFDIENRTIRITVAFDDESMSLYDPDNCWDFGMLDWENPTIVEAKIVG